MDFSILIPFWPFLTAAFVAGLLAALVYMHLLWVEPMPGFISAGLLFAALIAAGSAGTAFVPLAALLGTMVAIAVLVGAAFIGAILPMMIRAATFAVAVLIDALDARAGTLHGVASE